MHYQKHKKATIEFYATFSTIQKFRLSFYHRRTHKKHFKYEKIHLSSIFSKQPGNLKFHSFFKQLFSTNVHRFTNACKNFT